MGKRTCQHYPSALHCVKTRNKTSSGKSSSKRNPQQPTHETEQAYAAGWPPLGQPPLDIQPSTHSVPAIHPISNHILTSCVFAAVRTSRFLLAAHHTPLPVDMGDWAFSSTSSAGIILWCFERKMLEVKTPTLSIHVQRFWQPLSGGNISPPVCSLQACLPVRVTPRVQASHSITSITQDFSLSHIPTHASGAHMPT